jgi:hypothetical protein
MRISSTTESSDLCADLERVGACEGKAEIDNFLGKRVSDRFGFKDVVEEAADKIIKNVGRKAIGVK